MKRILAGLLMFSAFCAGSAQAAMSTFTPPLVTVPRLSASELKGRTAGEAVWRRPASITQFVELKGRGLPAQQTEVRIAYDNTNIYFAFKCRENKMDKLVAKYPKDGDPVWRDDSVAVVMAPGKDWSSFVHVTCNTLAAKYANTDQDEHLKAWPGKWTVRTSKQKDSWNCFMEIPFAQLGLKAPKDGDAWGVNFSRKELPNEELVTCWSPTEGTLQDPKQFGKLVFAGASAPIVTADLPVISSPTKYDVKTSAWNRTAGKVAFTTTPFCDGKQIPTPVFTLPVKPGTATWTTVLDFPYDGKRRVSLSVCEGTSGKTLFRTPGVLFDIPDCRGRLVRLKAIVDALRPVTYTAGTARLAALEQITALSRTASKPGGTDAWIKLSKKVDAAQQAVNRAQCAAVDVQQLGYALATENALTKVMRDKVFQGKFGQSARIAACRNEFESTQVVVLAYDKALENATVSVTALSGPGGAVIPADAIQLNLVDFVETKKPRYDIDYVGWYPDPLMDNTPFNLAKGALRPIWVTVHVPDDAKAGVYIAGITVKAANAGASTIPLLVDVWDFAIPDKPHMKTAFALFQHELGAWFGNVTDDMRRGYYKMLLDHRLNPTNIYNSSSIPTMEDMQYCVDNGLNSFCMASTWNKDAQGREKFAQMIREYRDFLKPKGWWDMGYVYGFDEIKKDKYPELQDMYGWIKQEFPDLPRMCTVVPSDALKGYIDIWVPLTGNWDQKTAEKFTAAGDQVWWYVCCVPEHPYANFFIDYPTIDPRILFWQSWKYHVPGFLYYAINNWETNRKGKRWPEGPWDTFSFIGANGDGVLTYPGPNGKLLSCIRLEAVRDGIEDYEYFWQLDDLVKKAEQNPAADKATISQAKQLLKVRDDVVKSVTEYTLDPDLLYKARAEVAQTIEKLSKEGR